MIRFAPVQRLLLIVALFQAVTVAAFAAAPPISCLYALDPSAAESFQIAGAQSVYTACGIVVESTASNAFEMEGSEMLYLQNHAQVSIVGGAQLNGNKLWDTISNTQVQPVQVSSPGDPLASITAPSSGTIVSSGPVDYDMNHKPTNNTLSPGVYCGGLTIGNTNGATFTMSPGVYVMAGGGLVMNSQAIVSGTGVTVYNTSSTGWGCSGSYSYTPVTISGQATVTLSAPTSGSLDGMLFFGNRTACATKGSCQDQINGGSTTVLNGALYFASDKLTITGSNASGYMTLVADKIYINGNSDFGDNGSPFDDITVSVSPSTAPLYAGQTQQFTATVANAANTAVTWSVSPSGTGSISASGLYTAPATISSQQTITITATSQADTSKSATATVTLYPPITVSVSPATATLYAGQTQQFTATVTNAANTAVTWSISPSGTGSISASGLYTAPAAISSQKTVTIAATSQANTSKSATATVTLYPPITVSMSPATATLYASQTQQFTATVTNSTNTAVTWSISPAGSGSISVSGLYTAPATISSQQTVTVTATSQANSAAKATATVTLYPPIAVSLSPSTATLYANQTQQFTATATNTTNTAVTWSISPAGTGTISTSGLYTAPSTISSQQTVTITATSQANSAAAATATVTLYPPIAVSVSPSTATLYASQTQQLTATVTNTTNTVVTWSITPAGTGSISASGLYTAPATISSQQTVTITAASQANSAVTATATVTLSPPIAVSVSPSTATLSASQSQQFTAMVTNTSNTAVTWSISPAGTGTISASGLYTAPSSISSQQTVTITATSQANSAATATVTVTLSSQVNVSISPQTATVSAGQTQAFTATVTGASNTAVTWSISPSNAGSIDAAGVYVAPASVTSQQSVTVTATSQANPAATASVSLTLSPACASTGFAYERAITIDHTKVPNTDQTNFPFLFSSTDPAFATIGNGGHVANANGYDIVFSTDPDGQTRLNYEMEEYNPATGQVIAWIGIPALSHSQNTTIYMLYGNPSITASQQNPASVWNSSYVGVWHLPNGTTLSANDSTVNGNNGTIYGATATGGKIDGGGSFDGYSEYIDLGNPSTLPSGYSPRTMCVWTELTFVPGGYAWPVSYGTPSNSEAMFVGADGSTLDVGGYGNDITVPNFWTVGNWTFICSVYDGATAYVYANGALLAAAPESWNLVPQHAYIGKQVNGGEYWPGSIDEVTISATARSADWIATEYNNQSSPPSFYSLSGEVAGAGALPTAVNLYASQSLQFTLTGACTSNAVWSMPSGSPGTLTSDGLYTAPAIIDAPQTITITGTTLGASTQPYPATITLLPPVSVSVTPPSAALPGGATAQFSATVSNSSSSAVNWTISPAAGTISTSGLYTAPSSVSIEQTVNVTATSLEDPTKSASATLTLVPPPATVPIGITLTPTSSTLNGGQTQQFTATVTNTGDTAVTWTIEPASVGTISTTGLYTAPSAVTAQQTVTIIATSQADTTQSATALITLAPSSCASTGYSYERTIVIDHTKVPNTDQMNFPVLFSTTDPLFATTANGGHVTSTNGYDIIFSSDPNGLTRLDSELEQYNPVTGQVLAWIRVPDLSHTSNTVLYVFYGNPAITTPQQNPTGAWDSNYLEVLHLDESSGTTIFDSTVNANNGTKVSASSPTPTTAGFIGGAQSFNGTSDYIALPPAMTGGLTKFSVSFWTQTTDQNSNGTYWNEPEFLGDSTSGGSSGDFGVNSNNGDLAMWSGLNSQSDNSLISSEYISDNNWHRVDAVNNGSTISLYFDGAFTGQTLSSGLALDTYGWYLGAQHYQGGGAAFFEQGTIDEFHFSNAARSADWIATEYNNQSSPATFYAFDPENAVEVAPSAVSLYAGQTQQFAATGMCSSSVTWSIPPDSPGSLSPTGLYTAPSSVTTQQTVTVTATSQANSGNLAAATVTLLPPVAVSLTPLSITLTQDQTQQFTATVSNSIAGVTWTLTPAGLGTISPDGVYQAPSTITTQQTVTVTATSQQDSTRSSSAMITLSPTQCASSGYGYQRVIVIDHTKVPNTDQANFPFLFNTTDPDLASTANGGHVTSTNGYDIFFSTDPTGASKLDHEIEQYNPITGQLVAWVRVPALSHNADTVLYLFYGNPSITFSQQNPNGVWDSHFQAVYHLANVTESTTPDSTTYGNSASGTALSPATGSIDGGAGLNGTSSYLEIPNVAFPNYPIGTYAGSGVPSNAATTTFNATVGMWFKTALPGGLFGQKDAEYCNNYFFICISYAPTVPGIYDVPGGVSFYVGDNGSLAGPWGLTAKAYNDNQWHSAAVTFATDGTDTLYVDGQVAAVAQQQIPVGYDSSYAYFVGSNDTILDSQGEGDFTWMYLNGSLDEVRVSNIARSGDWITTEYNNQSSPATFYKLYPATSATVVPSDISLYPTQGQQFSVTGTCNSNVNWVLSSGAPGALTSGGFYTAPNVISSQQSLTVMATSQSTGAALGTAVVTLQPSPAPITLAAQSQPPYGVGSTQTFEATLLDPYGSPEPGVTVSFAVTGANPGTASATTGSSGVASWSYTGSNGGSDAVVATAVINDEPLTSNSVTASWIAPTQNPDGTLALSAEPSLGRGGLAGAFTDSSGDVVEPLAIGTVRSEFIVPEGATQLQLGVDDSYYPDNGGTGFVVLVNGVQVTVPPTAMPWSWVSGGLNNNYQYGLGDGTAPVVAGMDLTPGQTVTIAYQSGTVSANYPSKPATNANGDPSWITGVTEWGGAYFPTLYTSESAYPLGQPIAFTADVTNGSGVPAANVPVTLTVTGANPGQYQATTDSTGTAAFTYIGSYAGTDNVQAQAVLAGNTLQSTESSATWVSYPTPTPAGKLTLTYFATNVDEQGYVVLATDASGNPIQYANVGFYLSGADSLQQNAQTDASGQAAFIFFHQNAGPFSIIAVDSVGRNVVISAPYNNTWTIPGTSGSGSNNGGVGVSISAPSSDTLPSSIQLTGSVTDTVSSNPVIQWSEVSGPGTVTFASPQQAVTTATFSDSGTYVLQLAASDSGASSSAQVVTTVNPTPVSASSQGLIGSPLNGSTVSGVVPITLAPGVTLQSGTLVYYPAANITDVTTLNSNTTGSGQIGTLDTTTLANGSYWIQMQSTDTSGNSQYTLLLVTVAGNYKPGRVTATVTDLVVPATGLAINIQRQYDSLNASTSGDFGYGWNLVITTNLSVDPAGDVTFTLGSQRRTFYFTPQPLGFLFDEYIPAFTPEPGFYGVLTESGPGCAALDLLVPDGSSWQCDGGGQFTPPGYVYTDATGTSYTISANGNLQSIVDRSGNTLTVTSTGITSSTGLNVPFVRDSSGRITQITDPQGNEYLYAYDTNGDLASVTYPNSTEPSTYTYDSSHLYTGGTDFRGNALPTTTYYGPTDTDPNGLPLNGRIESVTDALNETTSYAYNIATNTTAVTYPPDSTGAVGHATMVYDSYGDLLSSTDPLNNTTTNAYNANHDLTSTTDPLGHATSYTYDQNGNRTSSTYPATVTSANTTSTTQYNQYSEPISTTDELGNVRTFTYDGNYNPQSVVDSVGTLASFQFNVNGQMQAGAIGFDLTQQPANASQFTYDANGNMTSRTDALGRTTAYTYNSLGQKLTTIIPLPNSSTSSAAATTTNIYDPLGDLTQTAAPLGRTTSSTYDGNGNKISDTDARGNVTAYAYDALNRLIATTYPTQPVTTSTKSYDFRNNVIDAVDQAGHDTHYAYDLAGRVTSLTQAYGTSNAAATTYTYDNAGRKLTETDPLGHTTTYGYDNAGNLLSVSGPQGNFQYAYDNARNRISTTDGNGHTTQYVYDARKRLVQTKYPDSTKVTNAYDGPGNLISVTDQANNVVQYTYDAANQLRSVVQVNSPNTSNNNNHYTFDNDGNLISLADENGHTTQYAFDLLNERTAATLPDGSLTESRSYDANGNLTSLAHFSGMTTTYAYDPMNRLLSRTPDSRTNEATISFTYTPTGKRASMTDASGTTTYTYDSLDRLTTKATPEGTLSYTYDAAGNLASITSGDGIVSVDYSWDNLNRLSTITDNKLGGSSNVTTYTYDNANNLATATYPNGLQSTFQYDSLNRLTSTTGGNAGYLYNLGPTGVKTGATELTGRAVSWSFDGIYRLTGETVTGDAHYNGSVSYGLDPVGNRLSASSSLHGVSSAGFSYNADDQILGETYDSNGNTTQSGGKTFAYNSENQLVSMNGAAVTLVYDGDGNRVAKAASGSTTRYLVDDLNPTGYSQVVEETVNGGANREYTYGLQRIDEEQIVNNAWTPSFYGYDGFGTVRQLTSLTGAVTDTYEYDAFGNVITQTGTTPNNYLYRGEQFDPDLGLYYLRARYYNPQTGRFMSRDPEDGQVGVPASLHKYLYADGDPVDGVDPTGRDDFEEYRPLCCAEEKAVQQTSEEISCSYGKIGAALFGVMVHQYFLGVLVSQTGTAPGDWIMKTLPGQTGVDATYTGTQDIGYTYAELKPVNYSPQATGCQIANWGLPPGETSIWWYNKFGLIGQTLGFW